MDSRSNSRFLIACAAALTSVLAFAGCAGQRPLHVVKMHGDRAYEEGNYGKAAEDYSEYVDRKPGEWEVRLTLGRAYLESGQPVLAREQLTTVYDQQPSNEECIELLARADYDAKEYDSLVTFLRRLTIERGSTSDFLRLGRYSAMIGHADEAAQALKTAAKMDQGRTVGPQLALADFYHSVNDRTNELSRLRMALYLVPNSVEINERIRALGEVPGPTLALPPEEAQVQ
jgi:tetratricopeptide (TPR) repeat protein